MTKQPLPDRQTETDQSGSARSAEVGQPPAAERSRPNGFRAVASALRLAATAGPAPLAGYVALTLVASAVPVGIAWLTKLLLDRLAHGRTGGLLPLGVGLALATLTAALLPAISQYLRKELDRRSETLATDRLFRAVERFAGLSRFEDPVFQDRLRLARQSGGSGPNQVVDGILGVGRVIMTVTGFLTSLLVINVGLTIAVVCAAVPTALAEVYFGRRRAGLLWQIGPTQRREMFYGQLLTSVEAAKEVRLFGVGAFLRGRMITQRAASDAATRQLDRRELLTQGRFTLLSGVVSGVGLGWAVLAAGRGSITIGDLSMFIAAVAGVQGALASAAAELARTHESLVLFGHYLHIEKAQPDLPVRQPARPVPALRQGIQLRDVWFRYNEDHPWVLRGVTLHLSPGASMALVGLNGAGKSTLVKLLCRFYDPTRGSIQWDGVDLRDMDPAGLRTRVGAVFQDYMEYDLTAGENIGLGDLTAMDQPDRLAAAARLAGADEVIAGLPQGYRTLLSRIFFGEGEHDDPETGVVLSGGQWQRLALARGVLRTDPDLLILDEPSSGLDAEAEHEIHQRLRAHRAGRTSLLISHRLGAVRDADTIVVLAEGRIVEQGSHADLMAAGGRYARLFQLQASGYREPVPS